MKKYLFLLILGFFTFGFAETKTISIAVSDLKNAEGVTSGEASIISDRLRSALISTGIFSVMERNAMETILKEQGFQNSGACDDQSCIVQIGKILTVERIVAGTIGRVGTLYTISLRAIDVQTGNIISSINVDCPNGTIEDVATKTVRDAAEKLAQGSQSEIVARGLSGKTGDVFLATSEVGADIDIDGERWGEKTPCTLKGIPAGDHVFTAKKNGLIGVKKMHLSPDDIVQVFIQLAKPTGSIKIFSDPVGASVLVDNKPITGVTPLKVDSLDMGKHVVVVDKKDFVHEIISVEISPENSSQSFSPTLLPAAYVVIDPRPRADSVNILVSKRDGWESIPPYDTAKVVAGKVFLETSAHAKATKYDTLSLKMGEFLSFRPSLRPNKKAKVQLKVFRLATFGTLTLGGFVGGLMFNSAVKSHTGNANDAYAAYNIATDSTSAERLRNESTDQTKKAKADSIIRNGLYGAGALFVCLFGISIPF